MDEDERKLLWMIIGLIIGIPIGYIIHDMLKTLGLGGKKNTYYGVMFERDEKGNVKGIFKVPMPLGEE